MIVFALCRLIVWLEQLGPKSADVLKSCMDLLARGIIVPTAGTHAFPLEAARPDIALQT